MRKRLGRFGYGASEMASNLMYVSGFNAPDSFLWVDVMGQQYIIVSPLEYSRAKLQAREGVQVLSYAQAAEKWQFEPGVSASEMLAYIARAEKLYNWVAPSETPAGFVHDFYYSQLPVTTRTWLMEKLELDLIDDFCPERQIKSASEVEKLRHSERLAQAGLEKALNMIGEASVDQENRLVWQGELLTAEILKGELNAEIVRKGGVARGTIAAPGVQGACPHQSGTGVIKAHEPIVLDIFPRDDETGYYGDLTRTVVKGTASEIVCKAFAAVYDAQQAVLHTLKPGLTGRDAHFLAAETMEKHGFKTDLTGEFPCGFIHGLGHGVGLDIHEKPNLNTRNDLPLKEGNVVTVEPGLYYPEWGGIRIEDMVCITKDGIDNLATAPVFLEIE